jgi:RNA polymerase-binding transcription factor DksA
MADDIDRAQEQEQFNRERAIKAHTYKHIDVVREACIECDEPISALRQNLGAHRCIDCQTESERGKR